MKTLMKRGLLAVVILTFLGALHFLTGCSPSEAPGDAGPRAKLAANESEYALAFTWHLVDSRTELHRLYESGGGPSVTYVGEKRPVGYSSQLRGFTARDQDGKMHVYTLRPERVDGDITLTLGHEVMHVALGDYHD